MSGRLFFFITLKVGADNCRNQPNSLLIADGGDLTSNYERHGDVTPVIRIRLNSAVQRGPQRCYVVKHVFSLRLPRLVLLMPWMPDTYKRNYRIPKIIVLGLRKCGRTCRRLRPA
jgi:hypothetical protein